ncbi:MULTISPECIES: NAD(P)-dependent oxidoreductase [Nocardiopsis]|uniref:NAD(P)-dependent oxidoreductase n=1 Tax=Nocardiopsis TaxID=2013 RepID=UPI00034AB3EE|nr:MULTISPECIES: NAD(P)H-binding protein [Nocardiopsis]
MHLAVFGATGGTGRRITDQALEAGHTVTAVVRDPARLPLEHPRLTTATMTAFTAEALAPVLAGADAALSGLAATVRGGSPATTWARSALGAMEQVGERRIVAVSAVPVGPAAPGDALHHRLLLRPALRRVFADAYRDLAAMEEVLRGGTAPWTVVRPPRLTDGPKTAHYRTAVGTSPPAALTLSRADTAHAVLAALESPGTERQAVGVAY